MTGFGGTLAAVVLLWWMAPNASAQEAKVRISLPPQGETWVGERITFVVELLAPGFFAGTAAFDLPKVPGLLLAPPSSHPIVSSETIDGTSYTVQRHELFAFGRRGGAQTIPSFTVRCGFKRNPLDHETVSASLKTAPLAFTLKVPKGAEHLGNLLSARGLKMEETWSPEPGEAKAGDAFTRTITYSAPDVPAMAFPPFRPGEIDGLGIYAKPSEVLDHNDRGTFTGKRRDKFTYVCQRPGEFVIAGARLTWFDLDAQTLQAIDLPARKLSVAPNPALAPEAVVPARSTVPRTLALALRAVIASGGLGFLLWKMRRVWRRVIAPFRPVHLAPLNPEASQNSANRITTL